MCTIANNNVVKMTRHVSVIDGIPNNEEFIVFTSGRQNTEMNMVSTGYSEQASIKLLETNLSQRSLTSVVIPDFLSDSLYYEDESTLPHQVMRHVTVTKIDIWNDPNLQEKWRKQGVDPNELGLTFIDVEGTVLIAHVAKGTIGYRAGIMVGDRFEAMGKYSFLKTPEAILDHYLYTNKEIELTVIDGYARTVHYLHMDGTMIPDVPKKIQAAFLSDRKPRKNKKWYFCNYTLGLDINNNRIDYVWPDSLASLAGIKQHDKIIYINGKCMLGRSDAQIIRTLHIAASARQGIEIHCMHPLLAHFLLSQQIYMGIEIYSS